MIRKLSKSVFTAFPSSSGFIREVLDGRLVIGIFLGCCFLILGFMFSCKGTAISNANLYSLLECEELKLNIVQPYAGKVALAKLDVPTASYEWYVNDLPVEGGITATTFLAHFDDNLLAVDEEAPLASDSALLQPAKFGKALLGEVEYSSADNFNSDEGTIEMWLVFNEPLTSEVYNSSTGNPGIFKSINEETGERFILEVSEQYKTLSFYVYNGSGDWAEGAVQMKATHQEIPAGEPVYIAITFSRSDDRSNLYVNGFKHSATRYHFSITPAETFSLGNPNVLIDDFRIMDKVLNSYEIRENYIRGAPFAANEVYLSKPIEAGDELGLAVQPSEECYKNSVEVKAAKVLVTEPDGYVVPNAGQINFTFTTESEMNCAWGTKPDLFENLPQTETSRSITHSLPSTQIDSTLDFYEFYIKCAGSSDDPDDYAFYRRIRVLPAIPGGYPKLSNLFWGDTVDESEVSALSRYDVVGLVKTNAREPEIMKALRAKNPSILILIYKTLNGNFVWGFADWMGEDFNAILSDSWRLMDKDGNFVMDVYFPDCTLYNLYSESMFSKALARHVEHDMMASGIWDGIWYDNAGKRFWFLRDRTMPPEEQFTQYPDVNLDGVNEDLNIDEVRYEAEKWWADGIQKALTLTRQSCGQDVLIVGNGAITQYSEDVNGKMWEEFFGSDRFDDFFDPEGDFSFQYWQENTKEPRLNWNLFHNDYDPVVNKTAHFKRMRYGLAASVIGGVYFNTAPKDDNRSLWWYDEYCVDFATAGPVDDPDLVASCKGYLGEPLPGDAGKPLLLEAGVWRRDFENGIAIVSNLSQPVTVDLGGTYRYIQGTLDEDPVANPGGTTTRVTLSAYDGRILLR